MSRRRSNAHYQDRLDRLLVAQGVLMILIGGGAVQNPLPEPYKGWAVWLFTAIQAGIGIAMANTVKRLRGNDLSENVQLDGGESTE